MIHATILRLRRSFGSKLTEHTAWDAVAEQREVAQNCCLNEVKELGEQRKDRKSTHTWINPDIWKGVYVE